MSKNRTRYLAAAVVGLAAGATLLASPASALSFQQIQSTAKDGTITSNCFFQVTYVSLVTGTMTGKMNGQAQSANLFQGLGVKYTGISCSMSPDSGEPATLSNVHAGSSAQTGVHLVTLPLSDHYTLCTTAFQVFAHTTDSVRNCVTTP